MNNHLYTLKTITPLHCGVGAGEGDIDLPVAKSATTGFPIVPGTSIKGVLKDYFQQVTEESDKPRVEELFGPESPEFASAISVGDASLLALPVRSYFGTFAFLTSPLVLGLLRETLQRADCRPPNRLPCIPCSQAEDHYKAAIPEKSALLGGGIEDRVLLEDIDLLLQRDPCMDEWAAYIADMFYDDDEGKEIFRRRFIVADDNVLSFMCQAALPVDAHIAIDQDTGVVRKGALWYEESVPPESMFYGLVGVDQGYGKMKAKAEELSQLLRRHAPNALQVGGKATTGKGFVQMRFHGKEGN